VTPAEIEAGFDDPSDFEFLEIFNSGASAIDLNGISFTEGITFDYAGSNITSLESGERALVVENQAAFEFRYGSGHPIAGQFGGKLRNEGEQLSLLNSVGDPLRRFAYGTSAPWPIEPAGKGPSLVLALPFSSPDHALPSSWLASEMIGGTPGGDDQARLTFADWAGGNGVTTSDADDDGDGLTNLQEFILLTSPTVSNLSPLDSVKVGNDRLAQEVTYNLQAGDVLLSAWTSRDLFNWFPAEVEHTIYHGDGAVTTTFRSTSSFVETPREFIRLQFSTNP
jgi:hypothetical protein